jgi:glycosyltransferase involved in cell wall biosynthesis
MERAMTPGDITIAVTVFDRRDYIEQAVASALVQTLPVRVMVVEDCSPDLGLQSFVVSRFGPQITYHRNARRRGLFDNWNACIERCLTPWLCLLHDDDFLAPDFVEAMVELAAKIPGKGLYYGRCNFVDSAGRAAFTPPVPAGPHWQSADVVSVALRNPVRFPAELFRADFTRALGGFRPTSLFTGDWDMWFKLALHYGAAGTHRVVGTSRSHKAEGRGTVRVERNGKYEALIAMQAKKNAALLRQRGMAVHYDRAAALKSHPVPTRFLLENASSFSPRMLAYNVGQLLCSTPAHAAHRLFQTLARCLGPRFVSAASRFYHIFKGTARSRHPPSTSGPF